MGLESERSAWRTSNRSSQLFNPAVFASFDSDALELKADDLDELAEDVCKGLRTPKDYVSVKKMYVAVARSLTNVNWRQDIDVTDDFVVLASDVTMADLYANAKTILGARAANAMQREGLLGAR